MPSIDTFEACFPSLTAVARHLDLLTFRLAFPDDAKEFCPTPSITIPDTNITIYWPSLVVLCALGVIIGLYGAWRFAGPTDVNTLWSCGYFFFAAMNGFAFFAHCYGPTMEYSQIFLDCDIVSTSVSSFCLLMAALRKYPALHSRLGLGEAKVGWLVAGHLVLSAVAEACAVLYSVPFVQETLYIGVTAVAAAALLYPVLLSRLFAKKTAAEWLADITLAAGTQLMILSPLTDVVACRTLGNVVGNMLTAVFLGSVLGFVGLWPYAAADTLAAQRRTRGASARGGRRKAE